MAARQGSALDHSLLAHAGPTDIDVAMFHRDAGGGKAQPCSWVWEVLPGAGSGCMVTCSTPCSAATSNHMEHRRERQPLCHLAQPPPGQMAKDTASPQGGRTGGGNRGDICCCRISGDTGLPSTAQTFDSLELDQLGLGCGTGKQRLRDVGLLSLEDEADGILGLFAAALQGGAMRWSWGPLTGTW